MEVKYIFFTAMAIGVLTLFFIVRHIVLSIRERLKEHKELKSEKTKREADLRRLKSLWSNVTKSRDNLREHLKLFDYKIYKEIIPDNVQSSYKLELSAKFRYEHLLALYEFNSCPHFKTKSDIDNTYQKIIKQYKEYENAWKKFNNTLQETSFKHATFLSLL